MLRLDWVRASDDLLLRCLQWAAYLRIHPHRKAARALVCRLNELSAAWCDGCQFYHLGVSHKALVEYRKTRKEA